MQEITAERVLTPDGWQEHVRVVVHDGRIRALEHLSGAVDSDVVHLVPGFVDIQVNGAAHVDVATATGDDWDDLDAVLAAQGTTTWLPTVTTRPLDSYPAVLDRITDAMRREGARPEIAGVHLEGPFLGQAHGAHRSSWVTPIDDDFLDGLPSIVRLVTLGAENPGAPNATRALTSRGIIVSIGHSTPSSTQIDDVVAAGAKLVTHLFNAMSGIHHRDAGLALAALTDDRLQMSLIADGVHVSPRAMNLAWRARSESIILITDAVGWNAPSADVSIVDGAPRLRDGTLAGSCLTMDGAIRNSVAAGADLRSAVMAASTRPAQLLSLHDRGAIAPGLRADLVGLDDDLRVMTTWSAGAMIHRSANR